MSLMSTLLFHHSQFGTCVKTIRVCYLVFVMFSLPYISHGQTIIRGRVIAKEDSLVIPGVSVSLKGTPLGTQTNSEGMFELAIPDSLQGKIVNLLLSFVGYQNTTLTLNSANYNTHNILSIALSSGSSSLDDVVTIGYGTKKDPGERIPVFPWPPPNYTILYVLNNIYFKNAKTLANADKIITTALEDSGYDNGAYFYIPNGFALVTRIELIRENGTPLDTPSRWNGSIKGYYHLTWSAYLKALIFPNKGYYRIIVFAVTDKGINSSGKKVTKKVAEQWLFDGISALPESIAKKKYDAGYRCSAIIYQFRKQEGMSPELLQPGTITGLDHLSKSGILANLLKRVK